MTLNAAKVARAQGENNRVEQPILEAGTFPARLAQVIDLGLQPQQPWKGEPKPPAHEILLTFELTDEFMVDEEGNDVEDKPRWISETMPLRHIESDLAKSTKRYKALDPNMEFEGDFSQLLGASCNVLLVTKVVKSGKNQGKERNYVDSISAMRPKDAKKNPELQNEPKMFTLDEPDLTIFQSLPEWLQGKIKDNLEYAGSALQELLEGGKGVGQGKAEEAPEEAPEATEGDVEGEDDDGDEKPW